MKKYIVSILLPLVVDQLLELVTEEKFDELVDQLLDALEEKVSSSENDIDDAVILPILTRLREILGVPDHDMAMVNNP